jgi:hypothetical protein
MDASDAVAAEKFDFECAGGRTIMRAGGVTGVDLGKRVHASSLSHFPDPL